MYYLRLLSLYFRTVRLFPCSGFGAFSTFIQEGIYSHGNFSKTLEVEWNIKELGGRIARKKAFTEEFHHAAYTHWYDGTACMFEHDNQSRMESVTTKEEFRGRRLICHLIRHVQKEAASRGVWEGISEKWVWGNSIHKIREGWSIYCHLQRFFAYVMNVRSRNSLVLSPFRLEHRTDGAPFLLKQTKSRSAFQAASYGKLMVCMPYSYFIL